MQRSTMLFLATSPGHRVQPRFFYQSIVSWIEYSKLAATRALSVRAQFSESNLKASQLPVIRQTTHDSQDSVIYG